MHLHLRSTATMLLQPCFFATSAPSGGTDGNGNLSLNESKLPSQSQTPFSSLIIQEAPPASQNENNSELDSRMHNFIKSFDPASAGMRLVLAERIDKVMIRSELKKKRRVSVDLAQCKQQISVSAGHWFFPAADESVFNSLYVMDLMCQSLSTLELHAASPHTRGFHHLF
jgi:hypothetical protein